MPTITALTHGPSHHFYGYFGMSPWNAACTHHLALETDFHDHLPRVGEGATVGLVETATGVFQPRARTEAFNLQQGAMLRWIDVGFGDEFTYNDWEDGVLVARVLNPRTDGRRTIDGAIEAISPMRPVAIGLNYARIARCRPVVGYAAPPDDTADVPHPEDDGLFLLDLHTGERRLLLSIADVIRAHPSPETRAGLAYFHHVFFNPSGTRLVFFCRVTRDEGWYTSLWSMNTDGTDVRLLIDYPYKVSHLDWRDDDTLVVSTDLLGPMQFVAFTDNRQDFHPFGAGVLPTDGHLTFSPDRRWAAYDTSPGAERLRTLHLYHLATGRDILLGAFPSPLPYVGDIRCDLHPRWRLDGTAVSFDSIHEGSRQIYLADVSDLVS